MRPLSLRAVMSEYLLPSPSSERPWVPLRVPDWSLYAYSALRGAGFSVGETRRLSQAPYRAER